MGVAQLVTMSLRGTDEPTAYMSLQPTQAYSIHEPTAYMSLQPTRAYSIHEPTAYMSLRPT